MKQLYKGKFGSVLYGTNTPTSDVDIKAVHLEDIDRMLRGRLRETISNKVDKGLGVKNDQDDVDFESYELNKYINLLCQGQTVALDMLFTPNEYILENSHEWATIRDNSDMFLTKQAKSFIGYCRTQANKYCVKGERVAAVRDVLDMLTPYLVYSHFPLSHVKYDLDKMVKMHPGYCSILEQLDANKSPIKYFVCCDRMIPFGANIKLAHDTYKRVFDEYGKRALQAETDGGNDWKALSHAVRIAEEALELFQTKHITFPRPNAKYLLGIKTGQYKYQQIAEYIDALLVKVELASLHCDLPEKVDMDQVDDLVISMYKRNMSLWKRN